MYYVKVKVVLARSDECAFTTNEEYTEITKVQVGDNEPLEGLCVIADSKAYSFLFRFLFNYFSFHKSIIFEYFYVILINILVEYVFW